MQLNVPHVWNPVCFRPILRVIIEQNVRNDCVGDANRNLDSLEIKIMRLLSTFR